jgi:hypothetical protein
MLVSASSGYVSVSLTLDRYGHVPSEVPLYVKPSGSCFENLLHVDNFEPGPADGRPG